MRKSNKWVRSLAVICIGAMAVLTAWITARIEYWQRAESAGQQQNDIVTQFMAAFDRTLREQEEWAAEDFFSDDASIRACEAISTRDQTQLQSLVDAGLDVNATGKSGLTLLHWSLFEGNLEAFKLLLGSGADPDKKLTRFIFLHNGKALVEGDSILFTSMRGYYTTDQLNYFLAALEHSREKNPHDAEGNTLLLVVLRERAANEALLAPIIKHFADLNAQTEHGSTAAMVAVGSDQPGLALQILEAGADPTIRDPRGKSVADILQRKLELEKGNPDYPHKEAERLMEWLERHRASDQRSLGVEP